MDIVACAFVLAVNGDVKSSKSMLIKIGHSNLLHGCDFFVLVSLRIFSQELTSPCNRKKIIIKALVTRPIIVDDS